jgi:putative SOS response-associated peptidase YedK
VAASPLRSSLVTSGFAGILTAIYRVTRRALMSPQNSRNVPVIIRQKGVNEWQAHALGLIPHCVADPSIGNRMINARAETLTELPSFKLLVDRRRCIIPADGFYEWRKEGRRKVPRWVYLKTKEPFALAGFVGCVAQTGWEAGGVVYDNHHRSLMNWCGPFSTACP